jgi:ADP-ribosylglycohydrolase
MLGAISGDVIGSVYEWHRIKKTVFPLFNPRSSYTDDTVMTIATADAILQQSDYAKSYKSFGRRYPNAGYGGRFYTWLFEADTQPNYSFGNGSAMRVSPVGFAFSSMEEILAEAERSAAVSHNHPEGIKGAQATALSIFMARSGADKASIRKEITQRFGYNLQRSVAEIRPGYSFDETCQGTVPEAIIAFLDSTNYEDAIRLAVSLGGDSDTLACITGGIAHAFYKKIPGEIIAEVRSRLPAEFLQVVDRFYQKYGY